MSTASIFHLPEILIVNIDDNVNFEITKTYVSNSNLVLLILYAKWEFYSSLDDLNDLMMFPSNTKYALVALTVTTRSDELNELYPKSFLWNDGKFLNYKTEMNNGNPYETVAHCNEFESQVNKFKL